MNPENEVFDPFSTKNWDQETVIAVRVGCEGHEEDRGEQREEGALQEGVLPAAG